MASVVIESVIIIPATTMHRAIIFCLLESSAGDIFFETDLFLTAGFFDEAAGLFFTVDDFLAAPADAVGFLAVLTVFAVFFMFANLIPVTLGNFIGGGLMLGGTYYYMGKED